VTIDIVVRGGRPAAAGGPLAGHELGNNFNEAHGRPVREELERVDHGGSVYWGPDRAHS
jgi:hypothetical protein